MDTSRAGKIRRAAAYLKWRTFAERYSLWDLIMISAWIDELIAKRWGPAFLIAIVWICVSAFVDKPWRNA